MTNMRNSLAGAGQFQDEMKQLFARLFDGQEGDQSNIVTSQWTPRVDVIEEANAFVIRADIPGVDPKHIEINMENGILSIRGERQLEQPGDERKATRIERSHGVFYRRFALPDSADSEGIRASGQHGVLEIVIPKLAKAAARRITVE